MPQYETVHVKTTLSNVALAYFQTEAGFIADKVSPPVKVAKGSDYYFVFGREHFRVVDAVRRPMTTPVEIEHTVSTDQYVCQEYAMREAIADEEIEAADSPIEPEADAALYTSERLRLSRESRIATQLTTAANYDATMRTTLVGDDQWNEYTTSDPIGVIQTGIDAVAAKGKRPNTLWLGYEVWSKLKHHPDFIARLPDQQTRIVTPKLLQTIWEEITQVCIGEALYDTSVEGQTESLGYVWGKYCGICYVNNVMPNKKVPSFNYSFIWPYKAAQGRVRAENQPGAANGVIYQARTYRHADEGARATWVEVGLREGFKITGALMGYLISAAVA